ncbi:unnamed protein product [Chondrus crispus]|uniref:Sugar phosphate transporter domain-containing protein n=1 Tax=Chondrus crispus TaxID=2769 RepID=R7Q9Y3_CHOCR|nr:unnamed protein product [Chondrus crispus]CDF34216.1 unnamed protein product [Chondrus crispus]|eukprot:XP_005714035.1 unnamed protein product [Chondrus crispus]
MSTTAFASPARLPMPAGSLTLLCRPYKPAITHRRPRRRSTPYAALGASSNPPADDSNPPTPPPKNRDANQPSDLPPYDPGAPGAASVSPSDAISSPPPSSLADSPSFAALRDPAITVEIFKSVPASLVDASGALQISDGSFGASPVVPRRLVRRRPTGKKKLDFQYLRRQLAAGFDSGVGATLLLMALFVLWYWSNTVFNVYNKQVLKVFPYPLTCTVVQFAVAGGVMAAFWLFRLKKPPKLNGFLLRFATPLAVLHAAGFLLTNMSLGKVSVAFTHTVKSTEPFFSFALTPSILGDIPTWGILVSLFPIVAGVALASANEVSFNWIGLFAALGSNLALQWRNVLSKKLMDTSSGDRTATDRNGKERIVTEEEESTLSSLDNVNLFSTMSILAFFVLLPICFFWEGVPLAGAAVSQATTGISTTRLYRMLTVAGACRCLDVLSSYMILRKVSPVTHSVGNCVKRAVVIATSIIIFKTKVNALNIAGTLLALFGVFMYSIIVSACKQNSFGPDSPFCKPIYEPELELTEGGGI